MYNKKQPRKRILVVDDEKDLTLLVKLNLEKTGRFEVMEENRASKAIPVAREFKPDLILLDVMMPEIDGGDVLARLKGEATLKDVPVIFLTAMVLKDEIGKKGATIGGRPALPKPVQTETLLAAIDKALGTAAAPEPPRPMRR
jgi:CheY-like chemotaxis protein